MVELRILQILADGRFHSGTEIGKVLGLSRSAVWKQMKVLESLGINLYSIRGRGYRLPDGLNLLDVDKFVSECDAQARSSIKVVELETFTDSTNLMALRKIKEQNHGALYLTEYQSAGRGRRGRTWVGSVASNLYFSLIWRFSGGAASLEGLSLLVGLSIVQGLAKVGVTGVELKWPNDLLYQGKKLAGILLEMQGDASGEVSVVIGVGINVSMGELPKDVDRIDQPWIDLHSIVDRPIERNRLLAKIMSQLVVNLDAFAETGIQTYIDEWQSLHAFQDSYIRLITGKDEIEGICRGINKQGALLLERFGEIESHHGGEISVRKVER